MSTEDEAVIGHIFLTAGKLAKEQGFAHDGFRLVQNNGDAAGQTVFHLHIHLLAGRDLQWPPG
jgi:diadenosine tetraphosphate (Ap4A) HIT family hydrolase